MQRSLQGCLMAMCVALAGAAPATAVTGGEPAQGDWPAFVQIDGEGGVHCGATLIRSQWILTAAHCIVGSEPRQVRVILGSKTRGSGERLSVERVETHPGFRSESIPVLKAAWDVGLLKLAAPVSAPPVPLAAPGTFTAGTPALVLGLGADGFAIGSYRDELWQATIPVVSDDDCAVVYAGRFDARQHLCAGTLENESNACHGDSGGPLMVRGAGGGWTLAGVVSFGIGCATPGAYNVYARAAGEDLRGWIEGIVGPETARAGGSATVPPRAAAPASRSSRARLSVRRVRAGARAVTARIDGPAAVVVRDSRGRRLGAARPRTAGRVSVRLRRAARRGERLTVTAGGARRTVRVG